MGEKELRGTLSGLATLQDAGETGGGKRCPRRWEEASSGSSVDNVIVSGRNERDEAIGERSNKLCQMMEGGGHGGGNSARLAHIHRF